MSLHFRDEGRGNPLVLVHGMGASGRVFDSLYGKTSRRLIAIDLPRTARSGHWARSTPQHIVDELVPFLDGRGVERFELFGHSFGGLVALQMAHQIPQRVTGLTVASTPALGLPPEFKLLLANPLNDVTMGWFGRLPIWRAGLRAYLSLLWGSRRRLSDEHLAIYEEACSAPGFNEGMLEALRSVGDWRLPYASLRALPVPRRVLWGEKDRLVSVVQGEQLARAINAELTVLHQVGHCLPEEAPEQLEALLAA